MTLDGGLGDNRRQFERRQSGVQCVFAAAGAESRVVVIDASRGGFKMRFEAPDIVASALSPVPRDIVIADRYSKVRATVMWAAGALAGCRFHEHLTLDEVVRMKDCRFRIEPAE